MPQPVHAETQNGIATSGTTVTSASLGAGGADSGYLAFISTRSNVAVSSVSGLGRTWNLVRAQCAGRGQQRIECWHAVGAGSSGAVQATLASSIAAAVIIVQRYSDVDVANPVPTSVGINTNGVSGGCSGGTDNSSATGSLTTAHNNSQVVAGINTRNSPLTDTGGWTTETGAGDVQANSGGNGTIESVEHKLQASAGAVTIGGSGNTGTVDWCIVAVELKAAPAGGIIEAEAMTGGMTDMQGGLV